MYSYYYELLYLLIPVLLFRLAVATSTFSGKLYGVHEEFRTTSPVSVGTHLPYVRPRIGDTPLMNLTVSDPTDFWKYFTHGRTGIEGLLRRRSISAKLSLWAVLLSTPTCSNFEARRRVRTDSGPSNG
ncbi:hypothetical protein BC835DRAFT_1325897 [Cytidiella melzeri]|nr:hypothetical protein BC835DRAFT_1325897 [Cytidiella melzeri]